jgi:protein TonB
MFEQSILAGDAKNRPWSFAASVTAELLIVSLFILIPLAYTDHLPDFHWKSVIVGPPIRPINVPHVRTQLTTSLRPVFAGPARIFNPIAPSKDVQPSAGGFTQLEVPGFLPVGDSVGVGNPIGNLFWKPDVATAPKAPEATAPRTPAGPIRVSIGVHMAKLIKQVIPVYPPLARSARISGVVHLVGVIAKDGTIRNLQLLNGHPLLTQAAMVAVSQWVYKPTLLNGEPVEVICPIDVNFTLSQQ